MKRERTLVAIPPRIAAQIDKIAGHRMRTEFVVNLLENELLRREQLAALERVAGTWKDEDHPELADGAVAYVNKLRTADESRFAALVESRDRADGDDPSR